MTKLSALGKSVQDVQIVQKVQVVSEGARAANEMSMVCGSYLLSFGCWCSRAADTFVRFMLADGAIGGNAVPLWIAKRACKKLEETGFLDRLR
jgi:hypothetical protein